MRFKNIAGKHKKDSEIFRSLEDKAGHFGKGVCMSGKEPETFKSKSAVLLNNYWPRISDPNEPNPLHETHLLKASLSAAGPKDPRNKLVCSAILGNKQCIGNA